MPPGTDSCADLTARVQDLEQAVTALERAQAVAHVGNVEVDLETGTRTWSAEVYRLIGFDPSAGVPPLEAIFERAHPEDRERFSEVVRDSYAGRASEPFDYRTVLPSGTVRWIRYVAQVFDDPATGRRRLSSTLQDVTPQNEIASALGRTTHRLTRALAVGRMGFVDIDRRLGTRIWSPEMFALFAFPPAPQPPPLEAMLSRVHPLDHARVHTIFDRSYATGELAGTIEFRLLLPDGRVRWVRNVAQHEEGNRDRIMSIYLDITDLKLAQEAEQRRMMELASTVEHLERTRERLERAQRLARMGDAERFVGEPHRVWSGQMLKLHGLAATDAMPSREAFLERVHPDDRDRLLDALHQADTGEPVPTFDYRVVLPSGEVRWLRVHTETSKDPIRGHVRVASSTLDVTEQKSAELEMLRSLERERELGRLKADFLHMVTHEYRTPLGIIVSAAQILERYHERLTAGERAVHLTDIRASARRLADLMEEVLFLGKVEAGSLSLELQPTDCAVLVREVAHEVVTTFGPEREVRIDPGASTATVMADRRLLQHILANLISNALKYSSAPQPVWVDIRSDSGGLRLVVRDEGIGIPERDQPQLFEMFRRGSNVGAVSGTGLGLVVVKRCVDLHGGTLSLRSTEGVGTEITVHLPCPPRVATPAASATFHS
ncbi:MAG: PAS domain-containing protein [Opitutaceae bacterium]